MAPSGDGSEKTRHQGTETGSQAKGKWQTCLFSKGKSLIHLPSTQVFQSVDIAWLPFVGQAWSGPLTTSVARASVRLQIGSSLSLIGLIFLQVHCENPLSCILGVHPLYHMGNLTECLRSLSNFTSRAWAPPFPGSDTLKKTIEVIKSIFLREVVALPFFLLSSLPGLRWAALLLLLLPHVIGLKALGPTMWAKISQNCNFFCLWLTLSDMFVRITESWLTQ